MPPTCPCSGFSEVTAHPNVVQVKDGELLDKLKAGDRIRFSVKKTATGFVVTDVHTPRERLDGGQEA